MEGVETVENARRSWEAILEAESASLVQKTREGVTVGNIMYLENFGQFSIPFLPCPSAQVFGQIKM